mmetsp:Transcript_19967/g.28691  ORF Transcript_19967/g.28691 Transcript_19967/m.28691 type:complete len:217 (-) Transcript_19967:94-744(-)
MSPPLPELTQGYIKKEGHIVKTWKTRFFVLEASASSSYLSYYTDETREDMKGVIYNMRQCSVSEVDGIVSVKSTLGDTIRLIFDDTDDRRRWLNAFMNHIDYAVSCIPPLMKGYIIKQGHVIKNWKERFFILSADEYGSHCTYYLSSSESPPYAQGQRGRLNLKGYVLERIDDMVVLKSQSGEILRLKFNSECDKSIWTIALQAHIDYATSLCNNS